MQERDARTFVADLVKDVWSVEASDEGFWVDKAKQRDNVFSDPSDRHFQQSRVSDSFIFFS